MNFVLVSEILLLMFFGTLVSDLWEQNHKIYLGHWYYFFVSFIIACAALCAALWAMTHLL